MALTLIKQPNRWSCGLASLSMLLNIGCDDLIKVIGHDGSEIIFDGLEEPLCRRSFVLPELVDACLHYGYALVPIQPLATIQFDNPKYAYATESINVYADPEHQLNRYLNNYNGLILGRSSLDKPHMFAWDQEYVYDPTQPSKCKLDDIGLMIEEFHILTRIKQ